MMIDMGPFGVQPWTASPETDDPQLDDEDRNQCDWEPNGPLMFNLHHSKQHADGEGVEPLGVGVAALGDQTESSLVDFKKCSQLSVSTTAPLSGKKLRII